jgi:molybdate transport system substrate-binding protein
MGEGAHALTVFSAGAVQGALTQLAERFGRDTGIRVDLLFNTAGATRAKLEAGEAAELAIISAPVVQALEAAGVLAGATPLGRVGMGVTVHPAATAPDVSTVDAFRAALLKAASVAYVDPSAGGTGGIYVAGLLQRLGLADAVRPKAVLTGGGLDVARRVADGEAELGLTIVSEILAVPAARFAAPLPEELQNYITYVAAIPSRCRAPAPARRLLNALTDADARPVWSASGFESVR